MLVSRIPGPDHVRDMFGLEDAEEMPPGGLEGSRRRVRQPPRIPPAVHLMPEGQHHVATERPNLLRVAPDVAVVSSRRELRHADPAWVELDQRQRPQVHDLLRLSTLKLSRESVV